MMASSLPTPPPRSSSSSIPLRIPIKPPRPSPASVTSATAKGTTTSTTSTPDVPPPPSITGSTATGTTATSTAISGVSSTSSPPPIFPPLVNNHQPAVPVPVHPPLHHAPPRRVGPSHPPQSGAGSRNSLPPSRISTTSMSTSLSQPIISTQREIDEARQAVVASLGNMLDRELSGRAAQLHANNSAIEKQEKEMSKTLEGFRKDNDRLAKLAAEGTKKIKEIGNVQNWAEMLEREFLIVEETLRLVGEGGERSEGSWSGSESWSGSGSEDGEGEGGGERQTDRDGDVDMGVGDHDEGLDSDKGVTIVGKGKGKEREGEIETVLAEAMDTDLDIGAESSSRVFESSDTSEGNGTAGTDIKAAELQTTGVMAPETVALPPSPVGSVP